MNGIEVVNDDGESLLLSFAHVVMMTRVSSVGKANAPGLLIRTFDTMGRNILISKSGQVAMIWIAYRNWLQAPEPFTQPTNGGTADEDTPPATGADGRK